MKKDLRWVNRQKEVEKQRSLARLPPQGVPWRNSRASPHPGQFAGDKKAAVIGELSLRLKIFLLRPSILPNTSRQIYGKAKRRRYPISLIPDTGIRLFLAVHVAHEALPVQPAHGRGHRQAVVQAPSPREPVGNQGLEAKGQHAAQPQDSAHRFHRRCHHTAQISKSHLGF